MLFVDFMVFPIFHSKMRTQGEMQANKCNDSQAALVLCLKTHLK